MVQIKTRIQPSTEEFNSHFVYAWVSGVGLLPSGGSFVTRTDTQDFSIVIEKMSFKNSGCARGRNPMGITQDEHATFARTLWLTLMRLSPHTIRLLCGPEYTVVSLSACVRLQRACNGASDASVMR